MMYLQKYRKILVSSGLVLLTSLTMSGKVVTYPAPAEAVRNDSYGVEVRQKGGGEWLPVDVYGVKVDQTTEGKHNVRITSMAYFDFDGDVEVRVISRKQRVEEACIRPLSYNIPINIEGDSLTFTLDTPRNLCVVVNGDLFDNLQLFANPIDRFAPSGKELRKLLRDRHFHYFGPGYHKTHTLRLKDGETVYIAGGAFVDGVIVADRIRDARILGRGIVYPSRAGVYINNSRNIEVNGIFTTQCPIGGSDSVRIENVKVMSSYGWGDGFNVFASDNVTYRHIFARTSDDCTTVYATRKGFRGGCRNILTEDAVLWADVAHPFMIGLHGSAAELGADAPADVIENVVYRNVDVVDMNENQTDYQGVFAILAGDNNIVRNITFEDIRIENFRKGRLIDIRIPWNRKYCAAPGGLIENVSFKDIFYNGDRSGLSLIIGYDEERRIKGISFDNLVINGVHIHDKMPGKPGWYKTSDMCGMFIGEHVEDVVFK